MIRSGYFGACEGLCRIGAENRNLSFELIGYLLEFITYLLVDVDQAVIPLPVSSPYDGCAHEGYLFYL